MPDKLRQLILHDGTPHTAQYGEMHDKRPPFSAIRSNGRGYAGKSVSLTKATRERGPRGGGGGKAAPLRSAHAHREADPLALPEEDLHRRLPGGPVSTSCWATRPRASRPSTLSRPKKRWEEEHTAWRQGNLSERHYVYWWAVGDAQYFTRLRLKRQRSWN